MQNEECGGIDWMVAAIVLDTDVVESPPWKCQKRKMTQNMPSGIDPTVSYAKRYSEMNPKRRQEMQMPREN
jgi:hypothetical protein